MLLNALVPLAWSMNEAKAFWSLNVPTLLSVPPANCSELLSAAVLPLQVVVPFSVTVRPPEISLLPAPDSDSAPSYRVVPVPVWVPASQLEGPATVVVPAPPRVPPLCANDAMLETPFNVSVPALRLTPATLLKVVPTADCPR